MTKKLILPIEQIANDYLLGGLTTAELGNQYNCSGGTIGKHLKEYGVKIRPNSEARKGKHTVELPMDIITEQYLTEFKSFDALGIEYKCCGSTIRLRLLKNGVKLRSKKESLQSITLVLPEKEICDLYISGLNTVQLGKQYDCSDVMIGVVLKRNGVKTRSRFDVRKGCYDIDLPIDIISKEYLDGLTLNELGLKYNCSSQTIKKRLIRNDIDMRPLGESCIIELPIDDIIKKYVDGDSLEEIARYYDVSPPLIRSRLFDNNIELRTTKIVLSIVLPIHEIIDKYLRGSSVKDLAKEYDCWAGTIRSRLVDNNIIIRDATVKTDLHRENLSKARIKLHKDNPDVAKRSSATKQGQDFDAGEWTGFVDGDRSHVLPIRKCTQLNERFEGSEGHHITKSIVIFIPAELHQHYKGHNLKSGNGMAEINMVALQYINGGLD